MRGPEDFGAAFSALLKAAGASPDSVVQALNGAVARATLYDWKNGAHLPHETEPFEQVVRLCLRLAGDSADLRGMPRNVRGWLDLLAEAKQTRDNGTPAGRGSALSRSPLRDLDHDALWKIAGFLAGPGSSLLKLLGELAVSRSPVAEDLIDRLQETKGRYQTSPCVMKPRILPAADLRVARQHIDLLRAHHRAVREPGGLTDDRLFETISAVRGALEEIHGTQIVFVGEHVSTRKAGKGPTPSAPPGPGPKFDPRTQPPIVTKAEILPGQSHASIVVQGNPPMAVTPSGSIFVITVMARAPYPVILQRARAVVLDRRPPRRACFIKGITGGLTVRRFDVDLDSEDPQLTAQGIDFPFTVERDDPEQFWVQAVAETTEITWAIALDWLTDDGVTEPVSGTTVVTLGGQPFSLYPLNVRTGPDGQPLRTACDFTGHEEGCSALMLEQMGEPTSTFSPARDLNNECLFNGFLVGREMGWGG